MSCQEVSRLLAFANIQKTGNTGRLKETEVKTDGARVGRMAQWLETLDALAEDLAPAPTYPMSSSGCSQSTTVMCTYTHTDTYAHIINTNKKTHQKIVTKNRHGSQILLLCARVTSHQIVGLIVTHFK